MIILIELLQIHSRVIVATSFRNDDFLSFWNDRWLSLWNDWWCSFRKDWWFVISKCDTDLLQSYRKASLSFRYDFMEIDSRFLCRFIIGKTIVLKWFPLSFWNDEMFFSSIWWWLSLRYDDDSLFERKRIGYPLLLSKWISFFLSYVKDVVSGRVYFRKDRLFWRTTVHFWQW